LRILLGHAATGLIRARAHAMLLGRRTATEKLSLFLLDWGLVESHPVMLTLPMPRHDIADYLAMTAETVSRELHTLQRWGLITLFDSRRIWLAEPEGLRRLCV